MLVSFNDFGRNIKKNVKIEVNYFVISLVRNLLYSKIDTADVEAFGEATAGLEFESYNGGRDSRERMTQVRNK